MHTLWYISPRGYLTLVTMTNFQLQIIEQLKQNTKEIIYAARVRVAEPLGGVGVDS